MNRERLAERQPVVERILFNALTQQQASHAYLFVGPSGTQMKETALFLAQSLVCEDAQPFACKNCDACRRIEQEIFADLIILSGHESSIKKDDVLKLQESFSKTALERYGKKFYILDGADRATPEALNSLLKFLEEPSGNSTYAILISEKPERLLETIVSRCQVLSFKPNSAEAALKDLNLTHIDPYEAQLMTHLVHDLDELDLAFQNEELKAGFQLMACFLDEYTKAPFLGELFLQNHILKRKDVAGDRRRLTLFLNIGMMIFKDILFKTAIPSVDWKTRIERMPRALDPLKMFGLFNDGVHKISTNANLGLLIDALIYQLKEDEA